MRGIVAGTVLLIAALTGAARADVPKRQVEAVVETWRTEAVASFYGGYFHNRAMANGKRFDQYGRDAAHKTWPFGTRVRVTYPVTGLSEIVTISDRGPFIPGRTIDLSRGTAERIGLATAGVARVQLEILR